MDWFKSLFSRRRPNKEVEVEMKGSPEEEQRVRREQMQLEFEEGKAKKLRDVKKLEEDIQKSEIDSIERIQKEIEYNRLSHELHLGQYFIQKKYKEEIERLEKLIGEKLAKKEEQDWNKSGAAAASGGKRMKLKNAKSISKKSKRTKVKTTKGKKTRSKK